MSWSTNASRSAGGMVSSTTSRASPTESASSASFSGSTPSGRSRIGSGRCVSCLTLRERSVFREMRATTVVSQPPRFSTWLASVRLSRSQASCTASSASLSEPSIR